MRAQTLLPPLLAALALPGLPAAGADHLEGMTVVQRGIGLDGLVALQVSYRPTGECCGGLFEWDTGDGATGVMSDGMVDGVYAGNASGDVYLDDGRRVQWQRNMDASGWVRIDLWYHYDGTGFYTIEWRDCCPDHEGRLDVVAVGG